MCGLPGTEAESDRRSAMCDTRAVTVVTGRGNTHAGICKSCSSRIFFTLSFIQETSTSCFQFDFFNKLWNRKHTQLPVHFGCLIQDGLVFLQGFHAVWDKFLL